MGAQDGRDERGPPERSKFGTLFGQYPLKAVFDNLRLPALHTLTLQSRRLTVYNAAAITDIHAALLSAPALTRLSLGFLVFGSQIYDAPPEDSGRAEIGSDVEPLATYAPRLERLGFAVRSPVRRCGAFDFVASVFGSSHWLDLKNPNNTIREITLALSGEPPDDSAAELLDRNLLLSEVRRFAKDDVSVGFEDEEPVEDAGNNSNDYIPSAKQHKDTATNRLECRQKFLTERPFPTRETRPLTSPQIPSSTPRRRSHPPYRTSIIFELDHWTLSSDVADRDGVLKFEPKLWDQTQCSFIFFPILRIGYSANSLALVVENFTSEEHDLFPNSAELDATYIASSSNSYATYKQTDLLSVFTSRIEHDSAGAIIASIHKTLRRRLVPDHDTDTKSVDPQRESHDCPLSDKALFNLVANS
ncbi:hypothetical protein BJ912DRAFT_1060034 [Pholiota molesta]|nr:hypothetical protein BJ912DRAFT_1060034 [Pholiota molesta]